MGRTACTEPQCLYKGALLLHNVSHIHLRKKTERPNTVGKLQTYGRSFCLSVSGADLRTACLCSLSVCTSTVQNVFELAVCQTDYLPR